MQYFINNIEVNFEKSNNEKWNKLIFNEARRQLDGFKNKVETIEYKIKVTDISTIDLNQLFEKAQVVPGAYSYFRNSTEEYFYINRNKSLLKITQDELTLYTTENLVYSIPFLINILLIKDDKIFVHSAAFSYKNDGFLFCAFGGIGKTALLAETRFNTEIKILGDDVNIVSATGELFPYYRPFCIYEYHKQLFSNYFEENKVIIPQATTKNRIIRKLKKYIGIYDLRDYDFATIAPHKLFGEEKLCGRSINLKNIYVMVRENGINEMKISKINSQEATDFALSVMQSEFNEYYRDVFSYFSLSGNSFTDYIGKYKTILEKGFYDKNVYKIRIPMNYDIKSVGPDVLKEIIV
ncbi:hypothetical protein POL88_21135 [Priestia megaterium]|uniref:hypothetical protein n=1 Tax=Priestia megaterium TaxID=1404 RepID=UPI00234F6B4E|nr:hypothetical protein [Priestia megaterium]MDC7771445.1 hypothetical protein [Priestia megaterium]